VSQNQHAEAGLTFLELIVAVAVFGALSLMALPGLATLRTAFQLTSATRATAQCLRLARSIAVGKNLPSRVVVSGDGSTLTTQVLRDGSWTSTGTPTVLTDGMIVSAVNPTPSALAWSAQGIASGAVTVTVRASGGSQQTLAVGILGSVNPA